MGDSFKVFLIALLLLAVFTRETFVVILLYLFVGSLLIGRWWSSQALKQMRFQRKFDSKVFPGETVPVQIHLHNTGLLPAVWMRVQDYYPIEVADAKSFQQIITLGPRAKTRVDYTLKAHKRGYYTIGPLYLSSGDLLGLSGDRGAESGYDYLTVYPRVIPLSSVKLPSRSPMGTLKTNQPIFEDPSRPMGTRDYQVGDSLRRIDWKATASSGRMQTRLFEPSIALETILFLNLNIQDYFYRSRFDATELAIVAAGSLGNWISSQRQSVGLITNAFDPLTVDNQVTPLHPRKGRGQLMRILEVLARVRTVESASFPALIGSSRVKLGWGATLLVITGSAEQNLFDELIQTRRSGLNPVLILCGEHPGHRRADQLSKLFHIPVFTLFDETDMDVWRR